MSDSGYPQSDYSGSVNSRRTLFENRSHLRKKPYPAKIPKVNNSMENDFKQSVPVPKQQLYVDATYDNNVIVINGDGENTKNEYMHVPRRSNRGSMVPSQFRSELPQSTAPHMPMGYGGWNPDRYTTTPVSFQGSERVGEETRKKAQIQAYIAWVNVQLKKKTGSRVIEDLTSDLRDGVALSDLIEIVAGDPLEGIYSTPANSQEMVHNVERVISFMHNRRIRMHHTTATDIVDGNTKSIMRLILALAAHFKPNSVKQSSYSKTTRPVTMAGIAQGAVAALADARKDAARISSRPRRPQQFGQQERNRVSSETGSDSDVPASSVALSHRGILDGASSSGTSPLPSEFNSPRSTGAGSSPTPSARNLMYEHSPLKSSRAVPKSKSVDFSQYTEHSPETSHINSHVLSTLSKEHTILAGEMDTTKKSLLMLQDLLLNGRVPDGAESPPVSFEAASPDDEVVILRSKLQQSEELVKDLRDELSVVRNDSMQLQGVKAGLQQRLSEQEHSFLVMKADLLRAGFRQQTLENNKSELEQKLMEKDKLLLDLRRDVAKREREIDELKANFQVEQQQRDATARALRSQIQELHGKLQKVGETEATLSARVASQDRKMVRLEGKIMQTQHYESTGMSARPSSGRSTHSASSDDMQIVKDSLKSLRTHFHGNDSPSQHHVIDQLECSISVLMDRLQISEIEAPVSGERNNSERHSRSNLFPSTAISAHRSPLSAIHGYPGDGLDNPANGNSCTKILYFTDRTVTPFMCSVPKRLGEITLRDIKTVIDRPGNYRYHFKAMDPEFGTVKEEIINEDDIIPGWEGKVVAWIEEDHG